MPYFGRMSIEIERMILSKAKSFFESKEATALSIANKKLGSKIRAYRNREKNGKLSPASAFSLLLECKMIKEVIVEDVTPKK